MTTSITVRLPSELSEFLDLQVRQGSYADAGEYIASLVTAAKNESHVEEALLEGLAGPLSEWTRDDVEAMFRRLAERSEQG